MRYASKRINGIETFFSVTLFASHVLFVHELHPAFKSFVCNLYFKSLKLVR